VVEAVERHIEDGFSPKEAALKAMQEISGPVIGIALVLSAVFVPTAFIPGITGRLYQQFAVTIAISVILSAFNALSLSPALAALLLKPKTESKKGLLAKFFGWFNRSFERATNAYVRISGALLRKSAITVLILAGFTAAGLWIGGKLPVSFVPDEDQGYFYLNVQLPNSASLQRTEEGGLSRLSFREWREQAAAAAARLVSAGVRPGDRVLLAAANHPSWAISFFGILMAGATVVPLDAAVDADVAANLQRASRARVFVSDAKVQARVSSALDGALFVDYHELSKKGPMGLGLAAAVSSIAAGNVGGAAGAVSAASTGGKTAAAAGSLVGSAASGAATATAVTSGGLAATATAASNVTWLTEAARDIGYVANIVSPAASGAGAAAKGVGAYYHHEAMGYDADAKEAQSGETLENIDIDTALDIFARSVDRQLSAASQTQQLVEANQRSHQLIISGVA